MAIHHFFVANRDIVLFVYGQVFFVLGMAIALQSWRHSRLVLARSLPWLAAFGFAHAFHEWGYIFIPIQERYVAPPLIGVLIGVQIVLLALSFALLFQFGIEILRPLPGRWRYLRYLPTGLLLLWLWWAFFPALVHDAEHAGVAGQDQHRRSLCARPARAHWSPPMDYAGTRSG